MRRFILVLILSLKSLAEYGQIIADHTVVDRFDAIPQYYVDQVKKMWLVVAGESHSQGYRTGLELLEAKYPTYAVNVVEDGTPEPYTSANLRASRATWGDINNSTGWIYDYGEADWFTSELAISRTKSGISYCNTHNLTIGAIGFGWCYDDGTSIPDYVRATQEYVDYGITNSIPTKVFFTTGPVDNYSGEDAYINYLRWKEIRDSVNRDATRILFDYSDILCWDDDGTPTTTTWAGHTFPSGTIANVGIDETGHITQVGAIRLAKAMWWMLARIAGWDGVTTSLNESKEDVTSEFYIKIGTNEIIVRLDDSYLFSKLELYNLNGIIVASMKADNYYCTFNISHLSSGVYFLVVSGTNFCKTHKIFIS